jgi:hypothetical protein
MTLYWPLSASTFTCCSDGSPLFCIFSSYACLLPESKFFTDDDMPKPLRHSDRPSQTNGIERLKDVVLQI